MSDEAIRLNVGMIVLAACRFSVVGTRHGKIPTTTGEMTPSDSPAEPADDSVFSLVLLLN